MNHEPLRQILSAQPLPPAGLAEWESLRRALVPSTPARPSRMRRIRWFLLAGATMLLVLGGLWVTQVTESDSDWTQVYAISQLGSPGGDPTWVAMEVSSP
jgi:hypothetical protein